jgi:lysophospholipase L1-like esterase
LGNVNDSWDVTRVRSFVAVGDSFTEGLNDPYPGGDRFRGWADRVAQRLAETTPGLTYANLAVRGKLLREIVVGQVPLACELRPDLVSFCGGGNDVLRPSGDPDELARIFEAGVRRLRETGAKVLIFTGFDTRNVPVLRRLRGRIATYNMNLRAIADRNDCLVVDQWSMDALQDWRAWGDDRLHMSSEGHRRLALRVCEVLGLPVDDDWRAPFPPEAPTPWLDQRRKDIEWAREFMAPWVNRRLRGQSSGDGRVAKHNGLGPVQ